MVFLTLVTRAWWSLGGCPECSSMSWPRPTGSKYISEFIFALSEQTWFECLSCFSSETWYWSLSLISSLSRLDFWSILVIVNWSSESSSSFGKLFNISSISIACALCFILTALLAIAEFEPAFGLFGPSLSTQIDITIKLKVAFLNSKDCVQKHTARNPSVLVVFATYQFWFHFELPRWSVCSAPPLCSRWPYPVARGWTLAWKSHSHSCWLDFALCWGIAFFEETGTGLRIGYCWWSQFCGRACERSAAPRWRYLYS